MLDKVEQRLEQVKLELNKEKSKLVLCLTKGRRKRWGDAPCVKFTFLGYEFKPRCGIKPSGEKFLAFSPAAGAKAQKKLLETWRQKRYFELTHLTLEEVARMVNPIIRGWSNYFRVFRPSGMTLALHRVNRLIGKWMQRKYRISVRKAQKLIRRLTKERPTLFHHWSLGFCS